MSPRKITAKKWIFRSLAVCVAFSALLFIAGYMFLVKTPTERTQAIVTKFEIAVRNNDVKAVKELTDSRSPFVKDILLPRIELLKNELDKFHEGIEIYSCTFYPESIFHLSKGKIVAYGRMKAKVDNRYRDYFEIFLEQENGEWRIEQFLLPDYVDY